MATMAGMIHGLLSCAIRGLGFRPYGFASNSSEHCPGPRVKALVHTQCVSSDCFVPVWRHGITAGCKMAYTRFGLSRFPASIITLSNGRVPHQNGPLMPYFQATLLDWSLWALETAGRVFRWCSEVCEKVKGVVLKDPNIDSHSKHVDHNPGTGL